MNQIKMYRFLFNLCLIALHMGSNTVEALPVDGEILFDSNDLIPHTMPSSCQGKTFCFDKGDNYPENSLKKLLDQIPMSLNGTIARNLFFHDKKDNPDCPANTAFSNKPYYILDKNDKVRVVVQSPEKFQQVYSAKWCQRPGRITEDTSNFLKGSRTLQKYRIECVDQYMDVDFLVLSDEDFDLKLQLAKPKGGIPVCCRCRYS